jgi:hypothetical protein
LECIRLFDERRLIREVDVNGTTPPTGFQLKCGENGDVDVSGDVLYPKSFRVRRFIYHNDTKTTYRILGSSTFCRLFNCVNATLFMRSFSTFDNFRCAASVFRLCARFLGQEQVSTVQTAVPDPSCKLLSRGEELQWVVFPLVHATVYLTLARSLPVMYALACVRWWEGKQGREERVW